MNIGILFASTGKRHDCVRPGASVLVIPFILVLGLFGAPSMASADDWGFVWELGAITATPKGNPFVCRLTAARGYSEEFTLGPSFYLTPYGDNAMYSGSLNAQFNVALEKLRVSPFLGVGIAHRRTKHDDDTGLMVPMGLSVDTPIGEKLYLVGTFGVNLHGTIELEGKKDGASIGLSAGIGYGH